VETYEKVTIGSKNLERLADKYERSLMFIKDGEEK